jgi:GTP-binding protein
MFQIIDTGGFAPGEGIVAGVRAQVELCMNRADAVVWLVDGADGLTSADEGLARWVRPRADRVVVAVNKIDGTGGEAATREFHRLGFPRVVALSAVHGRNVNGLLEVLEEMCPPSPDAEKTEEDRARVAVVGRPNVGKSSFVNRLLGEERVLVSPEPGTTRDAVDALWEDGDKKFLFIDTAGLRAKKSKAEGLEGITRIMAERSLDRCEVALLLLDGAEGLTDGDVAVGRVIAEKNRACVVGVNKWDAVGDHAPAAQWYRDHAARDMPFMAHCPLVFLSAKTGQNVRAVPDLLWKTRREFHRRFDAQAVEAFFWNQVQERPHTHNARKLVFYGAEQTGSAPPVLTLRTNFAEEDIHFSVRRRWEASFRKAHGLAGVPLVFKFKRGKKP